SFFFVLSVFTDLSSLSLHDALPISIASIIVIIRFRCRCFWCVHLFSWAYSVSFSKRATNSNVPFRKSINDFKRANSKITFRKKRSEEHTSELQSRFDLVCRLLLEKK